jgi:pilus assembly protein Flp/PilA
MPEGGAERAMPKNVAPKESFFRFAHVLIGKPVPTPHLVRGRLFPGHALALIRRFLVDDERGATAIEYAMIAAGIGAAIAATVFSFGSALKTTFYDKISAML